MKSRGALAGAGLECGSKPARTSRAVVAVGVRGFESCCVRGRNEYAETDRSRIGASATGPFTSPTYAPRQFAGAGRPRQRQVWALPTRRSGWPPVATTKASEVDQHRGPHWQRAVDGVRAGRADAMEFGGSRAGSNQEALSMYSVRTDEWT